MNTKRGLVSPLILMFFCRIQQDIKDGGALSFYRSSLMGRKILMEV